MNTNALGTGLTSKTNQDSPSTEAQPSVDRYQAVKQYSVTQILGAWTATVVPMAVLTWIVVPWLSNHIGGRDPFIEALMICFNVGILWQITLVLILVRREQGGLQLARVCDALWLRSPKDPKTGRIGGKVWWWVVPFVIGSGVVNALPIDPDGPLPRDLPKTLEVDRIRIEHLFHGNWGAFALLVAVVLLAPLGEELFFRGLLLPRMRAVFGRGDRVANGVLFGIYHLHQPWSIPESVIDGIVNQAYPTRRYQSTWMGIITHTMPSFVIIGAVLPLVL